MNPNTKEDEVQGEGSFKAAQARYTAASQIKLKALKRWLRKLETFNGTIKIWRFRYENLEPGENTR